MGRVAAIQMTTTNIVAENLTTLERLIPVAAKKAAQMVVLPENVACMGMSEQDKLAIAEKPGDGPLQEFFSKLAKKWDLWIVGGTLPILPELDTSSPSKLKNKALFPTQRQRVHASCFVWDNLGNAVARYDKMHLFDVRVQPNLEEYLESETISAGEKLVCLNTPIGKLGLSICYDLRFPELYRKLFLEGAEIFTVPSAFTAITGKAHWEVLLRARAIENFSYVIAANQVGIHRNKRSTWGHSMIIDPWGTILQELPDGEGVIVADIDLDYLNDLRRRFPVAEHRRIF